MKIIINSNIYNFDVRTREDIVIINEGIDRINNMKNRFNLKYRSKDIISYFNDLGINVYTISLNQCLGDLADTDSSTDDE